MPRKIPLRDRRPVARRRYDKPDFAGECPDDKDKNPSPFTKETTTTIVADIQDRWPEVAFCPEYPLAEELTEAAELYGRLTAAESKSPSHQELRAELQALAKTARRLADGIDGLSTAARARLLRAGQPQGRAKTPDLNCLCHDLATRAAIALKELGAGEKGRRVDVPLAELLDRLDRIYTAATGRRGTVSTRDARSREGPFIGFLVACVSRVAKHDADPDRLWKRVQRQRKGSSRR